jgi:hypothetical protein
MARILRAVFSTGFIGSAYRSLGPDAGALSCAFWLQRISLLALGYSYDGSTTPSLSLPIDACETGSLV